MLLQKNGVKITDPTVTTQSFIGERELSFESMPNRVWFPAALVGFLTPSVTGHPFRERGRGVAERVRRVLMSCRPNYRDGLDAPAAPGAGPAGSVEQEAADFPLQAGSHLTPLTAPHNPSWGRE